MVRFKFNPQLSLLYSDSNKHVYILQHYFSIIKLHLILLANILANSQEDRICTTIYELVLVSSTQRRLDTFINSNKHIHEISRLRTGGLEFKNVYH